MCLSIWEEDMYGLNQCRIKILVPSNNFITYGCGCLETPMLLVTMNVTVEHVFDVIGN